MNEIKECINSYVANSGKFKGKDVVWVVTLLQEQERETVFQTGRITARGVAVCSPLETPDAKRGITMARNYALRALKGRENQRSIENKRAIRTVLKTDCPFVNHLEKNPTLTFHECRILFNGKSIKEIIKAFNTPMMIISGDTIRLENIVPATFN